MEDRRLSNKREIDTSQTLQEVFATVAHQWRSPLSKINSIVGSIDNLLYEEKINNPLITERLLEIEAITKEMSQSIDDYRGYFSKKHEHYSLEKLFTEKLAHDVAFLKESGIECIFNIDADIEFIGDDQLLKQIIVTLLENAKDAFVERNIYQPQIVIDATRDDTFLFIHVSDNAGGMSKSVKEKLFEPSFTTKHTSEGTGLGLFMVKKLLNEKMNASINVTNRDKGVCFTLQIPRNKTQ